MKRIISSILVLGVCLTPLTMPVMVQPSWAQSQDAQFLEMIRLLERARQQQLQEQPRQAIETLQQVLAIARQLKDRQLESLALTGIGFNYNIIGQPQEALKYLNQALPITRSVGPRFMEAIILSNIGAVYQDMSQQQEALKYLNQALLISRSVGDRAGIANNLNSIGLVYHNIYQLQKALEYYNQSLPIMREVGDRRGEATTLNNIAGIYDNISQPQEALKYYKQAFSINREVGNRSLEATTLNNIAGVYQRISQPQKALEYYNQALPISQLVGDRIGEAGTLNNIGAVYNSIGQPQEALKYLNQALPIVRSVGYRLGEAGTLNNIGEVYRSISQTQEALKYFNQALPISREVGNRRGEATTLNNIGAAYHRIGQPQEALKYYNQALPITREVGDRRVEAATLNNIAGVYNSIGQPQSALKYFSQALPITREVGDRAGEAGILNNIGSNYDSIGQPQSALKYFNQALPIKREVGDRAGEARILNNFGLVYHRIGLPQEALKYYNQALPISREVGDRAGVAATLTNIGTAYNRIGQHQEALKYYNQALPISREVGDHSQEATTLSNISAAYQDTKQPTKAIEYAEQSVQITLEMRSGLQRENRQKFLESKSGTAVALVDLLIDQNQPDRAFQWINIATTADLADYTRLIDAKVANPEAQKAIDEWNQKNQQLQFLRRQLEDNFSENLSRQMRELDTEVNRKAESISRQFPEVAELFETTPKDIAQLKASIAPDTAVIQPVLLTNISNVPNTIALFVLTKDSLSVKKIAINPEEFDNLLTQYRKEVQDIGETNFTVTGSKLYDILIRPLEDQIKAISPKQLSIIATGKLRYIPFETLYDEQTDKFLIQKYPVNYLTRISIRTIPDSTLPSPVLALGNPVPRPPQNLPGSEAEVRNIAQLVSGSSAYTGNDATLDRFKTQAPRFPFLHLATHGCFQPGGCQNLGMEENTLLFADSQFNIRDAALLGLQNTKLITLSACETAIQANSNGEEISGMAYIFERAGAQAVMASLWSVDDSATKDLMVQFYQNINQGMSKNEALRQAKLSQIQRHPFYWSPFILIGDAR
ncbi:CHAT domain-containing tetratricopeptide repeat protein [Microcoleus sp. MON2_D5]|uniref:CHAT domain-containing tetratricopeptide repeat protein n=1 Tax=Microcoleus sp. MON2_D5 TaxID=2818833 RepID=UPI002FCE9618